MSKDDIQFPDKFPGGLKGLVKAVLEKYAESEPAPAKPKQDVETGLIMCS